MSGTTGEPSRARRALFVLAPALAVPFTALAAFAISSRSALPLLATLALYPVFARLVLDARRGAAILAAMLWAVSLSATVIALTHHDEARAASVILNGLPYRDEMFAFIAAGEGRESEIARFLPQHALHLGIFAVAAVVSGGLLGLAMGAVLVDYMSFYVGALMGGAAPRLAAICGWPPYAVIRVLAFVILGTLLARPLLAWLTGRPIGAAGERRFYLVAASLLVLDVALKALLAPHWAVLLRPCLAR